MSDKKAKVAGTVAVVAMAPLIAGVAAYGVVKHVKKK